MKFRFVSSRIHGVLDYVAAAGLIVYPVLLDLGAFSDVALWLSITAGVGLIVYSLFTDYAFSLSSALSFRVHLILDVVAGAAFIAAIFLCGFEGIVAAYYAVMGLGVFALVAVTDPGTEAVSDFRGLDPTP